MINSISKIEHALYINLESRKDRKQHVEAQLKLVGISAERFNAVKLPDGALGCSMSHLKCLQMAKEKGWDHVLICEDDITFTNPGLFIQQINKFLSKQENWDVVLLAGNNMPPYKPIEDYCVQVTRCQTTTGYLVKSHYYDKLIDNIKTGMNMLVRNRDMHKIYAIDKYWFLLQDKDSWFLITPLSVVQREDYSDIEKRHTNYTKVMVDLDKKYMFEQPKIENMMNLIKPGGGVSLKKMGFI
uniref:Glycosyl transferase family 25 domain-containing protein n=1 Tax=viral metagenome TaxID=1070528 RepID=A0A6C0DUS8_9ZZZZ